MLDTSNERVLTCFYQDGISNQMISKSFEINIEDVSYPTIQEISSLENIKSNCGAKVIKTILSRDKTKTFVCYVNDYNNCDCLIYNIVTNTWSSSATYISGCQSGLSSMNIEYFDNTEEYILYCFHSETLRS